MNTIYFMITYSKNYTPNCVTVHFIYLFMHLKLALSI